jgi:hypothetical protein
VLLLLGSGRKRPRFVLNPPANGSMAGQEIRGGAGFLLDERRAPASTP